MNERTARTAEQGHITDRITKAVEQLGAEKTVKVLEDGKTVERTEPNLEVRLGAIYALERIARDSERDHIPIMETLCAYVRENSNARKPRDLNLAEWSPMPDTMDELIHMKHGEEAYLRFGGASEELENVRDWAESLPDFRVDVQAALTIIGRRGAERREYEKAQGYTLDLRRANLQKADLSKLELDRARLNQARLDGADLREVRLRAADLTRAQLLGADLASARMEGAEFWEARLECVNANGAKMEEVSFMLARLYGVDLSQAQTARAFFDQASLDMTKLP